LKDLLRLILKTDLLRQFTQASVKCCKHLFFSITPTAKKSTPQKIRIKNDVPSVCHRDQILVVQCLASDVTAELHIVLLRFHVACIEKNRQTERLKRIEMLPPRVIVELQSERQRMIVSEIQHFGSGVRHICEASERLVIRREFASTCIFSYRVARRTFCWSSPSTFPIPDSCQLFCPRFQCCEIIELQSPSCIFTDL
jgi:hypothetical protein